MRCLSATRRRASLEGMEFPPALVACMKGSRRVAVLTGAGISAESGLPTFRGADGLWNEQTIRAFATPGGFARNPKSAWEWYEHRRGEAQQAGPNAGHLALARWEERLEKDGGWLEILTQNIDGLHFRAGSKRITELHGSGWFVRCTRCGRRREELTHPLPVRPPRCPECGGLERPNVVFFGEQLPEEALANAARVARECELFLTVGTSGVVQPAASFILTARDQGASTLEVNLDPTQLSAHVTWALHGPSGTILPELVKLLAC
jgi:NAD-dependent deacetylase